MTKRTNPFTNDFMQQSKIHIGPKQFKNNEERLKKVYEKTLAMLYKGAKNNQQSCIIQNKDTGKKDGLKQLFIDPSGQLIHSGQMVNENYLQRICKCSRINVEVCAYCEKALCEDCECLCTLCQQRFCADCSLRGSEDSTVCVSCY